ncbi:uncharacterized protein LOC119735247 [Patiria miniata]|uniref:SWIM-type domain-containing protein n=1 Tax=Patiria miniata TaxID=46514 RepID=A0A914AMR1_PATMI|nr:uncharacterized protein LOC119735247 [Patiria miniata]
MTTTRVDILPKAVDLNSFGKEQISKRSRVRGYNFFKNGYVHKIALELLKEGEVAVQGKCFRSMRKSDTPHSLNVCFGRDQGLIAESRCSCVAGLSGTCAHIIALIYTLRHYQDLGLKEIPGQLSCTSLPQQWHKPCGCKIRPQSVAGLVMAKPKKTRKRQPVAAKVTKQSVLLPTCGEIKQLKALANTPLNYLLHEDAELSDTPLGQVQRRSSLNYQVFF